MSESEKKTETEDETETEKKPVSHCPYTSNPIERKGFVYWVEGIHARPDQKAKAVYGWQISKGGKKVKRSIKNYDRVTIASEEAKQQVDALFEAAEQLEAERVKKRGNQRSSKRKTKPVSDLTMPNLAPPDSALPNPETPPEIFPYEHTQTCDRSGLTALVLHYVEIKDEYPDAVLLYRVGDFFEVMFQDAVTIARELELVLTSKSAGEGIGRIPLAGVSHHACDRYTALLIQKGFDVVKHQDGKTIVLDGSW